MSGRKLIDPHTYTLHITIMLYRQTHCTRHHYAIPSNRLHMKHWCHTTKHTVYVKIMLYYQTKCTNLHYDKTWIKTYMPQLSYNTNTVHFTIILYHQSHNIIQSYAIPPNTMFTSKLSYTNKKNCTCKNYDITSNTLYKLLYAIPRNTLYTSLRYTTKQIVHNTTMLFHQTHCTCHNYAVTKQNVQV